MHNQDLTQCITRIQRMEQLYDTVSVAVSEGQSLIELRDEINVLSAYYQNGDWLHDYELDEQHLLPPNLKRGVLSQDGLYNLLCDLQTI